MFSFTKGEFIKIPSNTLTIGPHHTQGNLLLAPMAGVTDAVFRGLCAEWGAAVTFSEMITADTRLWKTAKTQARLLWSEAEPIKALQLAGAEPEALLQAGLAAIELGATWIDINMGCPMKKVCKRWAGSALMAQPNLVAKILDTLCYRLPVPVTIKTRLGPSHEQQNVVDIARIAEDSGVKMISIHGRTRAQRFEGLAEYDQIAAVKDRVAIPVIANGDIETLEQATFVFKHTGVDGVMLGRGAFGRPWVFAELQGCQVSDQQKRDLILRHILGLYQLYGESQGVKIARKHIKWYGAHMGFSDQSIAEMMKQTEPYQQQLALKRLLLL